MVKGHIGDRHKDCDVYESGLDITICPSCGSSDLKLHSIYGYASLKNLAYRYRCLDKFCDQGIFSVSVSKNLHTYENKFKALQSTCDDMLKAKQNMLPKKIVELATVMKMCR